MPKEVPGHLAHLDVVAEIVRLADLLPPAADEAVIVLGLAQLLGAQLHSELVVDVLLPRQPQARELGDAADNPVEVADLPKVELLLEHVIVVVAGRAGDALVLVVGLDHGRLYLEAAAALGRAPELAGGVGPVDEGPDLVRLVALVNDADVRLADDIAGGDAHRPVRLLAKPHEHQLIHRHGVAPVDDVVGAVGQEAVLDPLLDVALDVHREHHQHRLERDRGPQVGTAELVDLVLAQGNALALPPLGEPLRLDVLHLDHRLLRGDQVQGDLAERAFREERDQVGDLEGDLARVRVAEVGLAPLALVDLHAALRLRHAAVLALGGAGIDAEVDRVGEDALLAFLAGEVPAVVIPDALLDHLLELAAVKTGDVELVLRAAVELDGGDVGFLDGLGEEEELGVGDGLEARAELVDRPALGAARVLVGLIEDADGHRLVGERALGMAAHAHDEHVAEVERAGGDVVVVGRDLLGGRRAALERGDQTDAEDFFHLLHAVDHVENIAGLVGHAEPDDVQDRLGRAGLGTFFDDDFADLRIMEKLHDEPGVGRIARLILAGVRGRGLRVEDDVGLRPLPDVERGPEAEDPGQDRGQERAPGTAGAMDEGGAERLRLQGGRLRAAVEVKLQRRGVRHGASAARCGEARPHGRGHRGRPPGWRRPRRPPGRGARAS